MAPAAMRTQSAPPAATRGGGGGAAAFWACAFNLAKSITGAGMMGLPRAFRLLGSALGGGLVVAVGLLTYYSMAVLVAGGGP